MASRIDDLLVHIARLEPELEAELNRARDQWRYAKKSSMLRELRVAHALPTTDGSARLRPMADNQHVLAEDLPRWRIRIRR